MREMIGICVGMALGIWTASSPATPITGQVVDSQARPVAGAEVAVVENSLDWRTELQDARMCAPIVRTDERGEFQVDAQIHHARNAFVVARKPGLALAWDRAPLDAASAPDLAFHLVMEKPAAISGRVVDESGRPVARATVRAAPKTCYLSTLSQSPISLPEPWLSTQTDAEGQFKFEAFSLDVLCSFWVQASSHRCVYTFTPNYLSGCGYEVGRSDIRLILPAEHRLRGRVVEQGTDKPVAGVDLGISRPDDRREDIKDRYLPYQVRSDANGAFVFPGVPAGEHEIGLAYPEKGLPVWTAPTTRIQVTADSTPKDLTVEAVPGGIVEIRVRDARTRAPISGLCVSLPNMSVSRLPFTDSNGVARACLAPGESRALISSGMGGSNRDHQSWGRRGANDRFFVIRSETIRVDVDLEPAHKVSGIVVDPNGNAVPGATVKIHPLTTGSPIISNIGDTLRTDAAGRFELGCGEAEPVGWFVTACHDQRGWAGMAEVTELDEPVQIKLSPGVTVRGTVTAPNGEGIPAARVTVLAHVSGTVSNVRSETLCDAGGAFSLRAVLPSDVAVTHRLCVDASGYGPKSYVDIEVSPRAGAATDLGKIALVAANESLAGTVVDANDHPVAGIPIFLNGSRGVSQPSKTAATDENGRFRFDRICPGAVHLQANFSTSLQGWAGTNTEAGRQDVKIVLHPGEPGGRVMRQVGGGTTISRAPGQYKSLKGKPLAEVKELEPLLPAGAGDKPLLILFLDQQQRPSRGIVLELVKRTDLFKTKGVEIAAVQVAPLERADLDRWLADQKVPFAVQILPGGFDKLRHAWGVQSLPWLILTDKKHTVVAEGFALDDLDKQIQTAVGQ